MKVLTDISATRSHDELREAIALVVILRESRISVDDGLLVDESAEEDTCHHSNYSDVAIFIFHYDNVFQK